MKICINSIERVDGILSSGANIYSSNVQEMLGKIGDSGKLLIEQAVVNVSPLLDESSPKIKMRR